MTPLGWALLPVELITALALYGFALGLLAYGAWKLWRELRYRGRRAFRKGPVPPDGKPLDWDEMQAWAGFARRRVKPAREPSYPGREDR